MPRDPRRKSLLQGSVNPHARLIISINTAGEFQSFVADASHATQAFEAYQWLRNEQKEEVVAYN